MTEDCIFEGCCMPASLHPDGSLKRGGLCAGHGQQKDRGKPLTELREYGRNPWQALQDAACDLAGFSATDDAGWKAARDRLRITAIRYYLSLPRAKK